MKHFVVYHNPDTMGYDVSEIEGFTAVTGKNLSGVVDSTIWVVTSRDKPRRFYLVQKFVAEYVEEDHHSAGNFIVGASQGTKYLNEPELNDLPWFAAFKKLMGNFRLGFERVSDARLIAGLRKIEPGPALAAPAKTHRRPGGMKPAATTLVPEPHQELHYAISIRQPYAEQILQGVKRFEYRSQHTRIRERVWIYTGLKPADSEKDWEESGFTPEDLPVGVIVGSVEITDSKWDEKNACFAYTLKNPHRFRQPLTASNQPQPVFWKPEIVR